MKFLLLIAALYILLEISASQNINVKRVPNGIRGEGRTTRYWDCCKPSCSWVENVKSNTPVKSCAADGKTAVNPSERSGCDGGSSYMCSNQEPTIVNNTFALGFVAASFAGGIDTNMCCACMLLSFKDSLQGKQMLVQVTNTGSDLSSNHFDIAIPGGGVGIFTRGCASQWGAPSTGWGEQYGGVSSEAGCSELPKDLQDGCKFRFRFLENVSNPSVSFEQVECPSQIVSNTGCQLL